MQPTSLIELNELSISYANGHSSVVDSIDFRLEPGQRIGLIGPNGSGKTTILHAIMGLLPNTRGRITLFGRDTASEKDFAKARRKIGLLFQNADDQLFCPTVLEDVAFGPLNLGRSPREARKIAQRTLQELGLEGFEDRITYNLSGGEKKLVSLATILSMEPEVLLLDEPTNGLDESTKTQIIHILNNIRLPGITVSHDYDFLDRTTEDLVALQDGKLLQGEEVNVHSHVHVHPLGSVPHEHGEK